MTWPFHAVSHLGFPVWLPVFLPLWFCFLTFVISRFGWSRLAETHPGGPSPPYGRPLRRRSGKIGWFTNYNGCLNVTLSSEGIYIVPMWMFRLFHSPLLLPWSGVRGVEEHRIVFWRQTRLVFEDHGGPRFVLYLPTDALADLRMVSGRRDFP